MGCGTETNVKNTSLLYNEYPLISFFVHLQDARLLNLNEFISVSKIYSESEIVIMTLSKDKFIS